MLANFNSFSFWNAQSTSELSEDSQYGYSFFTSNELSSFFRQGPTIPPCSQGPAYLESNDVVGCRKRKAFTPHRSPPLNDPTFRGVTIRMENKIIDSQWKLVIHSEFSLSPKKERKFTSYIESSDEEESINSSDVHEEKHCASCSAKKTPLWRDAEDGTPLCNACGIRYKKYNLRCENCWHIPKKDEFSPTCQFCGSSYKYVTPRR